jgi:glycerophosphoryl diester phosphodiesterase
MNQTPLIIAHRGFSGKYPENSLEAFEGAIAAGADILELDIHFTQDQEIVVTHDFSLLRCFDTEGTVLDYTLEELHELGAPSLSEVLSLAKDRIALNIEIKRETLLADEKNFSLMAEKLLTLLDQEKMLSEILVSSFDPRALHALRKKSDKISLGLLDHEPHIKLKLDWINGYDFFSYHVLGSVIDLSMIKQLKKHNLQVYAWTINEEPDFRKMVDLKVDGIITDQVEKLRDFLNQ